MRRRASILALLLILTGYGLALAAITQTSTTVYGKVIMRANLIPAAVATGNGEWIDTSGMSAMTIHIGGITTATVEISGSNESTRPADATHGIKLNGTDITANQMFTVTVPVRWLKARVTAYTSGTINAWLEAQVGGN
jgi:hypothetical protein